MRLLGPVAIAALAACTSVRMVQREGCWIRRTEKVFGRVAEEIGPCARPPPAWVDDRVTRVVQECVAQADYRWQVRALDAWTRGAPYPPQLSHEEVLRACMEDSGIGLLAENERLKERLRDVAAERDGLRQGSEQERAHLRASNDRMIEYLGEAAKKPAGNATATATSSSDSKTQNESGAQLAAESRSTAPPTPIQMAQSSRAGTQPARRSPKLPASPAAGAPEPPCSCVPAETPPVQAHGEPLSPPPTVEAREHLPGAER